jgi:hypothetical protein
MSHPIGVGPAACTITILSGISATLSLAYGAAALRSSRGTALVSLVAGAILASVSTSAFITYFTHAADGRHLYPAPSQPNFAWHCHKNTPSSYLKAMTHNSRIIGTALVVAVTQVVVQAIIAGLANGIKRRVSNSLNEGADAIIRKERRYT